MVVYVIKIRKKDIRVKNPLHNENLCKSMKIKIKILSKGTYNGHILELNVELSGTLSQILTDLGRNQLTLGDQLTSIELGNNRLQDLVSDGGQDTLVVVHTQVLVDLRQLLDLGAVQHTQSQGHHLHILGSSRGRDVSGLGAHIKVHGALQPGDQKVGTLAHRVGLDSLQAVENNGAMTSLDYILSKEK